MRCGPEVKLSLLASPMPSSSSAASARSDIFGYVQETCSLVGVPSVSAPGSPVTRDAMAAYRGEALRRGRSPAPVVALVVCRQGAHGAGPRSSRVFTP